MAADQGDKQAKDNIIKLLDKKPEKKNQNNGPESTRERHEKGLIDNGYAGMYSDEQEPRNNSDQHSTEEKPKKDSEIKSSDDEDVWLVFRNALASEQSSYLYKKVHSIEVKRNFDIEEEINTIANDAIGDSVLNNGVIVEDYKEDLERLFDD